MIRWCSYCQSFLGEIHPFDDFSATHTICDQCKSKGRNYIESKVNSARLIADFYNGLREAAAAGRSLSIDDILAAGARLGIKDIDLCVGVIQPILHEIGVLWKNGQVTIAQEHLFTELSEQVIKRMKDRIIPPSSLQSEEIDVLLVCADGNYHTLGVHMIDMAIRELNLKSKVFTPGLPNREILLLLNQFRPTILGISLSLNSQVPQVMALAESVQSDYSHLGVKILVGGGEIRTHGSQFKNHPFVIVAPNDIVSLKKLVSTEVKRKHRAA